jgi:hypothetical protein
MSRAKRASLLSEQTETAPVGNMATLEQIEKAKQFRLGHFINKYESYLVQFTDEKIPEIWIESLGAASAMSTKQKAVVVKFLQLLDPKFTNITLHPGFRDAPEKWTVYKIKRFIEVYIETGVRGTDETPDDWISINTAMGKNFNAEQYRGFVNYVSSSSSSARTSYAASEFPSTQASKQPSPESSKGPSPEKAKEQKGPSPEKAKQKTPARSIKEPVPEKTKIGTLDLEQLEKKLKSDKKAKPLKEKEKEKESVYDSDSKVTKTNKSKPPKPKVIDPKGKEGRLLSVLPEVEEAIASKKASKLTPIVPPTPSRDLKITETPPLFSLIQETPKSLKKRNVQAESSTPALPRITEDVPYSFTPSTTKKRKPKDKDEPKERISKKKIEEFVEKSVEKQVWRNPTKQDKSKSKQVLMEKRVFGGDAKLAQLIKVIDAGTENFQTKYDVRNYQYALRMMNQIQPYVKYTVEQTSSRIGFSDKFYKSYTEILGVWLSHLRVILIDYTYAERQRLKSEVGLSAQADLSKFLDEVPMISGWVQSQLEIIKTEFLLPVYLREGEGNKITDYARELEVALKKRLLETPKAKVEQMLLDVDANEYVPLNQKYNMSGIPRYDQRIPSENTKYNVIENARQVIEAFKKGNFIEQQETPAVRSSPSPSSTEKQRYKELEKQKEEEVRKITEQVNKALEQTPLPQSKPSEFQPGTILKERFQEMVKGLDLEKEYDAIVSSKKTDPSEYSAFAIRKKDGGANKSIDYLDFVQPATPAPTIATPAPTRNPRPQKISYSQDETALLGNVAEIEQFYNAALVRAGNSFTTEQKNYGFSFFKIAYKKWSSVVNRFVSGRAIFPASRKKYLTTITRQLASANASGDDIISIQKDIESQWEQYLKSVVGHLYDIIVESINISQAEIYEFNLELEQYNMGYIQSSEELKSVLHINIPGGLPNGNIFNLSNTEMQTLVNFIVGNSYDEIDIRTFLLSWFAGFEFWGSKLFQYFDVIKKFAFVRRNLNYEFDVPDDRSIITLTDPTTNSSNTYFWLVEANGEIILSPTDPADAVPIVVWLDEEKQNCVLIWVN